MTTATIERALIAPAEPQTMKEPDIREGFRFERTGTSYKAVKLTKEEMEDGQEMCRRNFRDLRNRLYPYIRIDVVSMSRDREAQDEPIFIKNKSRHVLALEIDLESH